MSPQFRMVQCPPRRLSIISDSLRCLSAWWWFVSGRLEECSGVLPTTQFDYRKGWGTCDALLCVSHALQSALEGGQEARIVQIYFSAAFDRVNHQGIIYKHWSVGIRVSALSLLTQFLLNRSQHVMVDGCRSKLVKRCVKSAAGKYFAPIIVPRVHFGAFSHSGK